MRGSHLRATGDMVLLPDPNDPNHLTPRPQYEEVLPAAFPWLRMLGWIAGGAVFVLLALGVLELYTSFTGAAFTVGWTTCPVHR